MTWNLPWLCSVLQFLMAPFQNKALFYLHWTIETQHKLNKPYLLMSMDYRQIHVIKTSGKLGGGGTSSPHGSAIHMSNFSRNNIETMTCNFLWLCSELQF